jgi:hypothetical protein
VAVIVMFMTSVRLNVQVILSWLKLIAASFGFENESQRNHI